jgi:hypothetical protein
MAKPPAKGKKSAAKEAAPKKSRAKAAPVEPEKVEAAEDEDDDDDDDLGDEDEPKAAAAAPVKKPAPKAKPGTSGDEAPQVVPARRLTPEAKARVNEMVAKGVSLQEALRAAASWETFVAPVKEEPAKLVQGRSFEGGPRPAPRKDPDDDEDEAEEQVGSGDSDD